MGLTLGAGGTGQADWTNLPTSSLTLGPLLLRVSGVRSQELGVRSYVITIMACLT